MLSKFKVIAEASCDFCILICHSGLQSGRSRDSNYWDQLRVHNNSIIDIWNFRMSLYQLIS